MDKKLKSNRLTFYLFNSLIVSLVGTINLGICTALFSLMELSYIEISIIYTCLLFASLVFEYPSGILADRFGRKKIYAIGLLCISFQYFGYAYFDKSTLLYFVAVIGGIGGALVSGSFQAWIIVEEKEANVNGLKKTFTILSAMSSAGAIILSLVLVLLNVKYVELYFFMCIVMLIISLITFCVFKDNYGDSEKINTYNKNVIKNLFLNGKYRKLILIYSLSITYSSIFILFWQPKLLSIDISSSQITGFYSLYLLGISLINVLISKMKRINKKKFLLFCNLLMALSIILLSNDRLIVFSLGMIFLGVGFGAINPLFFAWISEIIDEDNCASIISFISAMGTVISLFVNIFVGYIMDGYGLTCIPYVVVCIGIVCNLILLGVSEKE